MVGGWFGHSQKKSLKEVICWGVVCPAATMNEGTQLFKKEDAQRLFEWLNNNRYTAFTFIYLM
jgi:6-phosphofructokinase 2